jgi:hypothetical protein
MNFRVRMNFRTQGEGKRIMDLGSIRPWLTTGGLREAGMARPERRYGPGGGITLGGIITIVGIIVIFVWSLWIGLIIALVGLLFFGGFVRGRWY